MDHLESDETLDCQISVALHANINFQQNPVNCPVSLLAKMCLIASPTPAVSG